MSNYKWNHTDVVSAMLEAPAIIDNKARLGLLVALTATSAPDPVSQWMKDKGLTWTDGSGRVHVRQDLEEGWRYMADTMVALVKKYGRRFKIGSLVIGEYFPGPKEEHSPDFNFDAFLANAKNIWSDVVRNAPLDANGNRINIMQVNPMLNKGIVTAADLANLKLGVSGSDPYLFRNDCGESDDILCDPGTIDRVRQELSGVVPLMHQGDATIFKNGESATWTGIANPFGYKAGQVVLMELEHVAWYFGSKGVIPVNSMTIMNHPLLTDDWFSTFDRFGPNGTDAPAWGQLPNRPRRRG